MIDFPRIKGELRQVLKPRVTTYRWMGFYAGMLVLLIVGFNLVASQYRTYSIPRGSIELTVPYVTYLVGEPITFTIKNNFNSAIYIPNECPEEPLNVYRFTDNSWVRLHAKTNVSSCPGKDRQIKVDAHSAQSGNYAAWSSLFAAPGKYRIVAYVDYFNVALYQDFEIIAKPEKAKNYVQAPVPTTSTSNTSTSGTNTTTKPKSTSTAPNLIPYSVSASGNTIRVEYSATYIYVRSISPAPGCTYEGGQSGTAVEVTFKCPGRETQIQLWVSGGQIHQKIE